MTSEGKHIPYGTWSWDVEQECLNYSSKETKERASSSRRSSTIRHSSVAGEIAFFVVTFKESIDAIEQVFFKKKYQRRVKVTDPEVVTVQDLKDIVIYLVNPLDLTTELIHYLHTPTMDRFFRALIVYFVYFFQVFETMERKRPEYARMLRNVAIETNEKIISENFADLRSILAKEYAAILMGIGENQMFHHMNSNKSNTSLSGKDRRLFEALVVVSCRVVWIALHRQYLAMIEAEISRLLRSDLFNIIERHQYSGRLMPNEKKIIYGTGYRNQRKLFQMSPIVQEITNVNHDFRLLSFGIVSMEPSDSRQKYLEAVFAAPEDQLVDMGIGIGILGWPRNKLDPMLKKLHKSAMDSPNFSFSILPDFKIPTKEFDFQDIDTKSLRMYFFKYPETELSKSDREIQCKTWLKYLKEQHATIANQTEEN